jgi:hypothetical protein
MVEPVYSKIIKLESCTVGFHPNGEVTTTFNDGAKYGAQPHDTDDYHRISQRIGCISINQYCQEHEFCHAFLAERLKNVENSILWLLAHGKPVPLHRGVAEEALVMTFQKYLMLSERPIIGRVDWPALRTEALEILYGKFA